MTQFFHSDTRMRIAHVIPDLGVGGAERMLIHLCRGLAEAGHDVRVVSLYPATGTLMDQDLGRLGLEVTYLHKRKGFDPAIAFELARALAELSPDVVHTHRAVPQYALPSFLRLRRMAAVHTIHNLADREVPKVSRLAHRIAFAMGMEPVAIGDAVADSFRRVYRRQPAAVIGNGIPTKLYMVAKERGAAWRSRNGIHPKSFVVATTARLSEQKNIAGLVRAFGEVKREVKRATLLIAGEGPERARIEVLARELCLTASVHVLGPRVDVPELLAAADVFALSSRWEGNPLSIMEALAAGLPIVATEVGGVPEILRAAQVGSLVPPQDDAALAAALLRLARAPGERARQAEAARAFATASLDVSVMIARYQDLYRHIVAYRRGFEVTA